VVFIEKIFSEGFEKLIDLNLKIIEYLMKHLRIPTKVELLSKLQIETGEPRLSVEICRKLGATQFLAQSGGQKNISTRRDLKKAGISLKLFNARPPVYPQLWGQFIPNLSAFDLLFNCGPKGHDILSKNKKVSS